MDQVVGVLNVKEALLYPRTDYHELLREPLFVPMKKRLSELLRDFKRTRCHLGVVLDEFGGVAGIVSLRDILEEIVGEMLDPFEAPEAQWRELSSGRVWISGAFDLREAGEKLGLEFPDDMGRTVGGFIMNSLGRLPTRGAVVRHADYEFRVLRTASRRVELVEARSATKRSVVEASPPPASGVQPLESGGTQEDEK
jgi:magnesium and cobalt transporter